MRYLLPVLLPLFSCVAVDEAPRVAKLEQGVLSFGDGGMRVRGTTFNAQLGKVIVSCPGDGGYIAGAPGDDSVWSSALNRRIEVGRSTLLGPLDPYPIVCLGQNLDTRVLVGGENTTRALSFDGGNVQVYGARTDSFATSPGFLAVGSTQPGVIRVFPNAVTGSSWVNPTFISAPATAGVGSSVSWAASGELLMGVATAGTAGVYPGSGDGGLFASAVPLIDPETNAGSDFGRVVLVGDVLTSSSGEENIVAAPAIGRVYIFSGSAHMMTLRGGLSFGSSLALEPGTGTRALWVGEPAQDRVYRFLGSQGTVFVAPPAGQNTRFGAAIAIDPTGLIAIGAPQFSVLLGLADVGAVFEARFDGGTRRGEPSTCVAGTACPLPKCTTGVCVGDVFCQQTLADFSDCDLSTEYCEEDNNECIANPPDAGPDAGTDAGTPDAGTSDAGAVDAGGADAGTSDAGAGPSDAGSPDAGPVDAGSNDVDAGLDGVQVFSTRCGCTSGGFPLMLLALALTRRRWTR